MRNEQHSSGNWLIIKIWSIFYLFWCFCQRLINRICTKVLTFIVDKNCSFNCVHVRLGELNWISLRQFKLWFTYLQKFVVHCTRAIRLWLIVAFAVTTSSELLSKYVGRRKHRTAKWIIIYCKFVFYGLLANTCYFLYTQERKYI